MAGSVVLVPRERFERWVANFEGRHGAATLVVGDGALNGTAADGSTFVARPPMGERYVGDAVVGDLVGAIDPPTDWGVLLVRKGGFAIARLSRERIVESKVGQRHVQGRTKAGGQSQQRFARRRDNQARQAFEAAADHAARILADVRVVVTGGDHAAVDEVLADQRLRRVETVGPWLPLPDPKRGVLEQAIADALSVVVEVHNAETS